MRNRNQSITSCIWGFSCLLILYFFIIRFSVIALQIKQACQKTSAHVWEVIALPGDKCEMPHFGRPSHHTLSFDLFSRFFFQKTADWHTTWTVGAISVYCGHYANLKYALMPAWCTKLCSTQERILHRIPYPTNAMWSIIKYISGYPLFKWPWFWRYFSH